MKIKKSVNLLYWFMSLYVVLFMELELMPTPTEMDTNKATPASK